MPFLCRFLRRSMSGFDRRYIRWCLAGTHNSLLLRNSNVRSLYRSCNWYNLLSLTYHDCFVDIRIGPLVGGFVFAGRGWKWTQWVPLMFAFGVYLFGLGMNETYNRSIIVRRATRHGVTAPRLADAQSGVTLRDMCLVTVVTPASQMVSEPIVIFTSIYLGFNWGVIFSFFISIPVVLKLTYAFTIQQAGLAFIAAIVGAILAGVTTLVTDMITYRVIVNKGSNGMVAIEYRLIPAMLGGFLMTASLFWIAWTANPKINWAAPVIGTLVYVWGNMSILVSCCPLRESESAPILHILSDLIYFVPFRRVSGQRNSFRTHGRCRLQNCACRRVSPLHYSEFVYHL